MIDRDGEDLPGSFLSRWSRRKRGLDNRETEPVGERADLARDDPEADADPGATTEAECGSGTAGTADAQQLRDFKDFDFDSLDYESDYTQFMGNDVSSEARQKALRKLWVSNPVLANMDGLDDYCEDYTDAAVCLPKGMMKTAYQYGRGFLSDDEVAEWEALGRPADDAEAQTAATTSDEAAPEEPASGGAADPVGGTGGAVDAEVAVAGSQHGGTTDDGDPGPAAQGGEEAEHHAGVDGCPEHSGAGRDNGDRRG